MACIDPIYAYVSYAKNSRGVYEVVFAQRSQAEISARGIGFGLMAGFRAVALPCGRCLGCRAKRVNDWVVRCSHESLCHRSSYFVTLTYDSDHLPVGGSLCHRDFQLFMKRLRRRFGVGVRYYMCGEYGSKGGRPHYHVLLYGLVIPDLVLRSVKKAALYTSEIFSKLWPLGFHTIGSLTSSTIRYTVGYINKRVYGNSVYYGNRVPEYSRMSLRPAIGRMYYDRYYTDFFKLDKIVFGNSSFSYAVPRYYNLLYRRSFPDLYDKLVLSRVEKARGFYTFLNTDRGRVDYESMLAVRLARKERSYEGDFDYSLVMSGRGRMYRDEIYSLRM